MSDDKLLQTTYDPATGEILDERPFDMDRKGLTINGRPTLPQWIAYGQLLQTMASGSTWAVGDWIIYGESRTDWGEMYSQALSELDYDYGTLRNIVSVCKRWPRDERRDLSFSHHAAVVALEERERAELLDQAEAMQLSSRALKALVDEKLERPTIRKSDSCDGDVDQIIDWLYSKKPEINGKRLRVVLYEVG